MLIFFVGVSVVHGLNVRFDRLDCVKNEAVGVISKGSPST